MRLGVRVSLTAKSSICQLLEKRLIFWAHTARLTGEGVSTRRRSGVWEIVRADLKSWAVDVGASYQFKAAADVSFSLSAGLAYGSGDSDREDGIDRDFRQTGLHRNKSKFHGVKSFRYYGLVFDPELSNMLILTAGVGMKPTERSSIDIVVHAYRQIEPWTEIRDTNINSDPNGIHDELGSEIDLVAAWQLSPRFNLKLSYGVFFPGDAFDSPDNQRATIAAVKLSMKF